VESNAISGVIQLLVDDKPEERLAKRFGVDQAQLKKGSKR
jgi:hypothetical protein